MRACVCTHVSNTISVSIFLKKARFVLRNNGPVFSKVSQPAVLLAVMSNRKALERLCYSEGGRTGKWKQVLAYALRRTHDKRLHTYSSGESLYAYCYIVTFACAAGRWVGGCTFK